LIKKQLIDKKYQFYAKNGENAKSAGRIGNERNGKNGAPPLARDKMPTRVFGAASGVYSNRIDRIDRIGH
jgi:hypothetical protein